MSLNYTHSYVAELERLILDELLPIYEQYHKEHGMPLSYKNIHPDLLRDIKQKHKVPAVFKPIPFPVEQI